LGGADGGGSMDARATIKTTMWRWARGRTQPRLIGSEEGGEEIDLYVLDTIRECLPLRATSLGFPALPLESACEPVEKEILVEAGLPLE